MKNDRNIKTNAYQDILANIPGALFRCLCDPDMTLEYISGSIADITRYPCSDTLFFSLKTFSGIINPDDREQLEALRNRAISNGNAYSTVYSITDHDGNIRMITENGNAFVDNTGQAYIDGILVDTTNQDFLSQKHATSQFLLKEKTEELERYFTMSLDLLCIANTDGQFIKTNPEWYKLLGYTQDELDGRRFLDFVHPDDIEDTLAAISTLASQQEVLNFENRYRKRDGSYCWIEWRSKPQGNTIYAVARDITYRKRTEQFLMISASISTRLNTSKNLKGSMKKLVSSIREKTGCDAVGIRLQQDNDYPFFSQDGFCKKFLTGENSLISRCNAVPSGTRKSPKDTLECICGRVIEDKTAPSPLFTPYGSFWTNDSSSFFESPDNKNRIHRLRDRCVLEGFLSIALIPIRSRNHVMGLLQLNNRSRDFFNLEIVLALEGIAAHIGEAILRYEADEQILHMATHDSLTDLPGIRLAKFHLDMAMKQARRTRTMVAVLFVDLDGFKTVNDNYGHDIGDKVLKETAVRLRSSVRETDTVARIGGDEFLVILTGVRSTQDSEDVARKIMNTVSQPFVTNRITVKIGTSIGIAFYPKDTMKSDTLIRFADKAMYRVKSSGKNNYTFFSESTL